MLGNPHPGDASNTSCHLQISSVFKVAGKKDLYIACADRRLPFYIMMLPGLAYLIINNYLPMFGTVIAYKKLNFRKGIFGSDWVGFANFKFLYSGYDLCTGVPGAVDECVQHYSGEKLL